MRVRVRVRVTGRVRLTIRVLVLVRFRVRVRVRVRVSVRVRIRVRGSSCRVKYPIEGSPPMWPAHSSISVHGTVASKVYHPPRGISPLLLLAFLG